MVKSNQESKKDGNKSQKNQVPGSKEESQGAKKVKNASQHTQEQVSITVVMPKNIKEPLQ